MPLEEVTIPTEKIANEIANYTIGFAKLTVRDRVEDALCSGSGTLVFAGRVFGILTAAHVLSELPESGEVGLVTLAGQERQFRKLTIEMSETKRISLRPKDFGPDGPDIGFLRLPESSLGWLQAINSFYNLTKTCEDLLADIAPGPDFTHAVVGMIGDRTKSILENGLRKKGFEAVFSDGNIVGTRHANGYDLLSFLPNLYPDTQLPGDFRGTSGGALWRVYIGKKDASYQAIGKRLWGVPFYQSLPDSNGRRTLTCHNPNAIYTSILDEITKLWPNEVEAE